MMKKFFTIVVTFALTAAMLLAVGCGSETAANTDAPAKADAQSQAEAAVTVTGITLALGASKTEYMAGDVFDPTGITLRVSYSDGSAKNVSDGFTYSTEPLKAGDTAVTISYEGQTVEQAITVSDVSKSLILRFGSGDCTRCYGDGTVIVGGVQINSYIFVDGDDSSLDNLVPTGEATGGASAMDIAATAGNVGTWSWDGKELKMTVNNHTEDVEVKLVYNEEEGVWVMQGYDFVDYVGQTYTFGGACDKEAVEKYLTPDRVWPVAKEE